MRNSELLCSLVVLVGLIATAAAQEPTLESRLREALRKTTADLHALQDQNETQQADLARAKAEAAALTQQNADLKARLDAAQAAPRTAPAPAAPPANEAELAELRAALATANARAASLQVQMAAAEAASRSRVEATQAQLSASTKAVTASQGLVKACRETNGKLANVATDILNTYKNESFRSVWLRSYEPVLGLDRVKLQNIMQDFEDRILDQRLPPTGP